jgi:hypothetical protein
MYNNVKKECEFCQEELGDEVVHALGRDFHPDCAGDLWKALCYHFSPILRSSDGV